MRDEEEGPRRRRDTSARRRPAHAQCRVVRQHGAEGRQGTCTDDAGSQVARHLWRLGRHHPGGAAAGLHACQRRAAHDAPDVVVDRAARPPHQPQMERSEGRADAQVAKLALYGLAYGLRPLAVPEDVAAVVRHVVLAQQQRPLPPPPRCRRVSRFVPGPTRLLTFFYGRAEARKT